MGLLMGGRVLENEPRNEEDKNGYSYSQSHCKQPFFCFVEVGMKLPTAWLQVSPTHHAMSDYNDLQSYRPTGLKSTMHRDVMGFHQRTGLQSQGHACIEVFGAVIHPYVSDSSRLAIPKLVDSNIDSKGKTPQRMSS